MGAIRGSEVLPCEASGSTVAGVLLPADRDRDPEPLEPCSPPRAVLRLHGAVQHYEWSSRGDASLVARLAGESGSGRPCAELWMGTHPAAPRRWRRPTRPTAPTDRCRSGSGWCITRPRSSAARSRRAGAATSLSSSPNLDSQVSIYSPDFSSFSWQPVSNLFRNWVLPFEFHTYFSVGKS